VKGVEHGRGMKSSHLSVFLSVGQGRKDFVFVEGRLEK